MSVSGKRNRTKPRSIERSRAQAVGRKIDEPHAAQDGEVAERLSLLADGEAWARAGEELRRVDPKRYLAILKVVEDICSIHRDPLGEVVSNGFYVFPTKKDDDFS